MPFDNPPVDRLTFADLAWRLRHPETWPKGFVWDYGCCATCAMGLAWELSGGKRGAFDTHLSMTALRLTMALLADAEAIAGPMCATIFLGLHHYNETGLTRITPGDVADAIERHLAPEST
jgi:hypothetical protein